MREPGVEDATRRTRLANERTYLAWWRTGLTALAVGIGIGKLVPERSIVTALALRARRRRLRRARARVHRRRPRSGRARSRTRSTAAASPRSTSACSRCCVGRRRRARPRRDRARALRLKARSTQARCLAPRCQAPTRRTGRNDSTGTVGGRVVDDRDSACERTGSRLLTARCSCRRKLRRCVLARPTSAGAS